MTRQHRHKWTNLKVERHPNGQIWVTEECNCGSYRQTSDTSTLVDMPDGDYNVQTGLATNDRRNSEADNNRFKQAVANSPFRLTNNWEWTLYYGVLETFEAYRVVQGGIEYQVALRLDGKWYASSYAGSIGAMYGDKEHAMDACARAAGLPEKQVRHTWGPLRCKGILLDGERCEGDVFRPYHGLCRDCQQLVDDNLPVTHHMGKTGVYIQFVRPGQQRANRDL